MLTADVMFVNNLPFVFTYGRWIKLITVEYMPTQMAKQLAQNLKKYVLSARAEFVIKQSSWISELPEVVCCQNWMLHQNCQGMVPCQYGNDDIQKMPDIMTINLVHFCVIWLNVMPVKLSISSIYIPRELICC